MFRRHRRRCTRIGCGGGANADERTILRQRARRRSSTGSGLISGLPGTALRKTFSSCAALQQYQKLCRSTATRTTAFMNASCGERGAGPRRTPNPASMLELEGWDLEDLVIPPGLRRRRMQALQDD